MSFNRVPHDYGRTTLGSLSTWLTTILLSMHDDGMYIFTSHSSSLPLSALGVLVSEGGPLCPGGCDPPLETGIVSVVMSSLSLGIRIDTSNSNLVLG